MNETFMKEKPVFSLLVSMAFPMVISMLVNSLYNIVDSYFVAKISEDAMTALSLVFPVQNFINAAGIGFGVGMNAVISFYLGAKDYEKADMATTQGLLLSAVHGVLLTIVSIEIMPFFLRLFTGSEAVAALGIQYSDIAFSFALVVSLSMAFEKIFQAYESDNDQFADRLLHQYCIRSCPDFWTGIFSGNGDQRCCACYGDRTGINVVRLFRNL